MKHKITWSRFWSTILFWSALSQMLAKSSGWFDLCAHADGSHDVLRSWYTSKMAQLLLTSQGLAGRHWDLLLILIRSMTKLPDITQTQRLDLMNRCDHSCRWYPIWIQSVQLKNLFTKELTWNCEQLAVLRHRCGNTVPQPVRRKIILSFSI